MFFDHKNCGVSGFNKTLKIGFPRIYLKFKDKNYFDCVYDKRLGLKVIKYCLIFWPFLKVKTRKTREVG